MSTTYRIAVSPAGFDQLSPVYEAEIIQVVDGVMNGGPRTSTSTLSAVDAWMNGLGFYREGDYGPLQGVWAFAEAVKATDVVWGWEAGTE